MSNKLIESFLKYEEHRNSKTQETNPFNDAYELDEATTFRTKRSSGNEAVIKGKKWGITSRGTTVGRGGSSPEQARKALLRDASRTGSGIGSVEATRLRALAQRQKARSSGSSNKAAKPTQVAKAKTPNLQGSGQTPASGYVGPSAGIKVDTTDNARANATRNALSDIGTPKTATKVTPKKFSNAGKNEYSEFGTGAYEAAKKRKDDAEAAALTTQNVSLNRNTGYSGAQDEAGKAIADTRPPQPTADQATKANAPAGAVVAADGTVYKNEADFNAAQQETETKNEIRDKAKQKNLTPTITTPTDLSAIPQGKAPSSETQQSNAQAELAAKISNASQGADMETNTGNIYKPNYYYSSGRENTKTGKESKRDILDILRKIGKEKRAKLLD